MQEAWVLQEPACSTWESRNGTGDAAIVRSKACNESMFFGKGHKRTLACGSACEMGGGKMQLQKVCKQIQAQKGQVVGGLASLQSLSLGCARGVQLGLV